MSERIKSSIKIFGHLFAILFTLALFLIMIFGLWKLSYYDTHFIHYDYDGQNYVLHINEEMKDTIIDMQYDDILISKIVSNKYAKENDFYKEREKDFFISFIPRFNWDYEKIIQYMLSQAERSVDSEN